MFRAHFGFIVGSSACILLPFAIIDGLGLGIGPFPLLDADLLAGRLIAPLAGIKVPRTGYVALVPFDAEKSAPLRDFVDWLVAEGQSRDRSA